MNFDQNPTTTTISITPPMQSPTPQQQQQQQHARGTTNANNTTTTTTFHKPSLRMAQSPRQRLHAQQKLHVQTQQLSTSPNASGRRKRLTSTFPNSTYPQHKKVKWVATKKIAKHKGELTFFYTTPSTVTPTSSCDSPTSPNSSFGNRIPRKKVYAVLTDKKMELFEAQQPFSLPDMICQSPLPTPLNTKPLSNSSSSNADHQFGLAALTAAPSTSTSSLQHLIMINDNEKPSQYDSTQQNVGLVGKIYLCPQLCGGRVQVVRAGKSGFRIIVTGETPKTSPELKMNELLTPTSATPTPTAFETNTPLSPKSPYFLSTQYTSSDCSTPNINSGDSPTPFPPKHLTPKHQPTIPSPLVNNVMLSTSFPDDAVDDNDEDGDVKMTNANQVPSPHDESNHIYGTSRGKFDIQTYKPNGFAVRDSHSRFNSPSGNNSGLIGYLNSDQQDQSLYFSAESEAECDEWIMHIQQVISSLNNRYAYLLDEILLYIFSFLDAFDLCKSIAPASLKFMSLAQNEILWNNLYIARWKKKEYSILYYSAMLNVSTPYLSATSFSKTRKLSCNPPLVTWKYVFTKRYALEKVHLHKESTAEQNAQTTTNNVTGTDNNNNDADLHVGHSMLSDCSDPGELEKRRREEEERKKREEEERNKALSSEFLKDGNSLFNAADAERDVATKRLLWLFCIDNYDACLIYNPSNWTAARNWAVALIRLEKLVNSHRGEVQAYLKMILTLCVEKFENCMKLTPNNDEVLTLWAGFLSDLALKIHDPNESDRLFKEAHKKFEQALAIKPYIGTYNDYGISFCDMAEKKIRQLKKRLHMTKSCMDSVGNGNTSSHSCEEEDFDGSSEDEDMIDEKEINEQKEQIIKCLEGSSKLYEKCLAIQPDYFHAINNMGFNQKLKIDLIRIHTRESMKSMTPIQLEEMKRQRHQLVGEACEFFSRCVTIKDFVIARNNWGNILLQEAKEHEAEHRFALLQQCIEQYKRAMELEPSNDGCVCRCAIAYLMSAEIRLKDLKQSQQRLDELSNAIKALQQYTDEESKRRFNSLMTMAQQQHEVCHELKVQCQRMYEQAAQGFSKLKNKGLSLYNMSCLNAVFAKEAEAKKTLTEAFEYGYILTVDKLNDDSDFDSIRHCDWFQQLLQNLREREQKVQRQKLNLARRFECK